MLYNHCHTYMCTCCNGSKQREYSQLEGVVPWGYDEDSPVWLRLQVDGVQLVDEVLLHRLRFHPLIEVSQRSDEVRIDHLALHQDCLHMVLREEGRGGEVM